MRQAEAFEAGEANKWFERNEDKLTGKDDPVLHALAACNIKANRVLEVGCANGWRLERIEAEATFGVDPLGYRKLERGVILNGTAQSLGFGAEDFDLVIYGWCLYLCDREDLFQIVSEGDRVLKDRGHLVIHDFHPFVSYRREYKHREGLFSYKMDYSKLWRANPAYHLVGRYMQGDGEDRTSVSILQKDIKGGWPLHA